MPHQRDHCVDHRACLVADHDAAQNSTRAEFNQKLREAMVGHPSVAHGAAAVHVHPLDVLQPSGLHFFFGHTDSSNLGVGEDCPRHPSVVDGRVFEAMPPTWDLLPSFLQVHKWVDNVLEKILALEVGAMAEEEIARQVAETPNSRARRPQLCVHLHETTTPHLHPGLVQVELWPDWSDARADEQLVSGQALLGLVLVEVVEREAVALRELDALHVHADVAMVARRENSGELPPGLSIHSP
mmetsp:Transcript_85683/g.239442  ORF Transcript_85683/g.239442 Transcript_85683/m.239442 type:complete len:241 (+) Transcript_85683:260-982(+)